MAALNNVMDRSRELLSQAILDVLGSWPELDRRVFVQAHYQGRPIENISGCLGLSTAEVRRILETCERKLLSALRDFRNAAGDAVAHCSPERTGFSFSGCCR